MTDFYLIINYVLEENKSVYVPSFKPIDQDVMSISKYAVDIDWLSKEELFGGYCLASSNHSDKQVGQKFTTSIRGLDNQLFLCYFVYS